MKLTTLTKKGLIEELQSVLHKYNMSLTILPDGKFEIKEII